MTYGQWLRGKRRELNLTQADVEKASGVGGSVLSKYENDQRLPTEETRLEIHRILRTTDDDLVDLGILERVGESGRIDWPWNVHRALPGSNTAITRSDALNQIREAAGEMQWTQAMAEAIVQQVKLLREMQMMVSQRNASKE